MFHGLLKPKFYNKCKTALKLTKTRLETVMKKRKAVEKYLKNDIADLLKNGLDINAYGRADGLLAEQNMTSCYLLIEQFCGCISSHLQVMDKQRECPEECKEAVPSIMYAAARFADLPELRELRSLFAERYGNSLDQFANKELRSQHRSKEMKLQLMHDIALEFSIEWDSKALEQKLFTPPPQDQVRSKSQRSDVECTLDKSQRSEDHVSLKREKEYAQSEPSKDASDVYHVSKRNDRDLPLTGRKDVANDAEKLSSSSDEEVFTLPRKGSSNKDKPKSSSTNSSGSLSGEEAANNKPLRYRDIRPPYVMGKAERDRNISNDPPKPNTDTDPVDKNHDAENRIDDLVGETKPKPMSVRRRKLKPPPGHEAELTYKARQVNDKNKIDDEEEKLDGLLMHYSKKQSPYDMSKVKGSLKPPPAIRTYQDDDESVTHKSMKPNMLIAPARAASFPTELETPTKASDTENRHLRSTSLEPDMLAGHVHPKLPDCDDLAARIAALRGR